MTDMKSIRFPAPAADDMVRAIPEGRKTVTRLVVKPQPGTDEFIYKHQCGEWFISSENNDYADIEVKLSYRPGDILYVQETWQHGFGGTYLYRASAGHDLFMTADGKLVSDIPWRPSIHMPHEAARIFLRVTDVRVERLREITPEQLRAEGFPIFVTPSECENSFNRFGAVCDYKNKLEKFSDLWDSTIKPADRDLYGWEANPWVWVIEFERCGKPEGGTKCLTHTTTS